MNFNLCQFLGGPTSVLHTLHGFDEVVESVRWGLTELGHHVTVKPDELSGNAINIVIGLLGNDKVPPQMTDNWPEQTIIYNHEQIAGAKAVDLLPISKSVGKRLHIWDYSKANLATWNQLAPKFAPLHVPVGWAPTLRRVPTPATQDIDVLIYGMNGVTRFQILWKLCEMWFKTVFVCGLYGAARDDLIARSKIVLNINKYPTNRVFEEVRVSYLLGNGKAVVSDTYPEYRIDDEMRSAILFTPLDKLVSEVTRLIDHEDERKKLEAAGPAVMARRDIRPILHAALASSGFDPGVLLSS